MLSLLKINNLALIEEVVWEMGSGLIGITGETGSGKSMVIGALKLIVGQRADTELIRTGEDTCTVEAIFDLKDCSDINIILDESGLEPCSENQLVIRRVLDKKATNKQFINCSPVTLNTLKKIGKLLVDLHGPHDHHSLFSSERQLSLLDAYAGLTEITRQHSLAYKKFKSLQSEYDELINSERSNEQAIDLLKHQINEIDEADIKEDEEEQLYKSYHVSRNSKSLLEASSKIISELHGEEHSVIDQLMQLMRSLKELEKFDSSATEYTEKFENALVEIQELQNQLETYAGSIEMEPSKIEEIECRVDLIETLKRKYGNSLGEVLGFRESAHEKLNKNENRHEELKRLEKEIEESQSEMHKISEKITKKRISASPKLAKLVTNELKDLGFKKSIFEISLEQKEKPTSMGAESIEFLFAPNPGEPSKALRSIASSGEMSRVMLALKSTLAGEDAIPVLVFDEIDANVGGAIAQSVGIKMASLGKSHQVISISHLPQVASLSKSHYVVKKEFTNGGRTRSEIMKVDGKERVAEIARMLGGEKESAQQHAHSLMQTAA
ncbi:MAG: DNA repair protein RecN [Verrucomicrobiaceae bacterium]|nr:MAG: DNA repair protein RecN [Verrucomicrobiaceae bacterium]